MLVYNLIISPIAKFTFDYKKYRGTFRMLQSYRISINIML